MILKVVTACLCWAHWEMWGERAQGVVAGKETRNPNFLRVQIQMITTFHLNQANDTLEKLGRLYGWGKFLRLLIKEIVATRILDVSLFDLTYDIAISDSSLFETWIWLLEGRVETFRRRDSSLRPDGTIGSVFSVYLEHLPCLSQVSFFPSMHLSCSPWAQMLRKVTTEMWFPLPGT